MYSFSTENWSRPDDEVSGLMEMFERRIEAETPDLHEEGVRIRFIGRRSHPVPPALIDRIRWAEEMTAGNTRITFCVAFNYGGRAEIIDAARTFTGDSEEEFRAHLYAPDMHDPDLIIRTSGEQRSSNFLLWQGRTPRSCSATSCGRTSRARCSRRASTSSRRAVGASEVDRWPPGAAGPRGHAARAARATRASRAQPPRSGAAGASASTSSRARRKPRKRRGKSSELLLRVLVAIPLAVLAIVFVEAGGIAFALFMIAIGWLCMYELYRMLDRWKPLPIVGFAALAGMVLAGVYGGQRQVAEVAVATLPVLFLLTVARGERHATVSIAGTLLGVYWIGFAFAHAALLRELPHGNAVIIDVLIGTFIGDTGAYLGGRLFGRRPLAPKISPNKTVEGLACGMIVAVLAVFLAGLYQTWLTQGDALAARRRGRGAGPDRRPVRVAGQARRGHQGRRYPVRPARRRARPGRRRPVHARGRLLRVAGRNAALSV